MTAGALRVLLTNDDGPPSAESPYIYGLYKHLVHDFGWNVKVVIPSSQKSWVGKAHQIKDIIKGQYYYPRDPDGIGEIAETSRPLQSGEVAEWILLDGTPATCCNIALHNLYPGQIDLVLSGPNLGRNTSAAFALSSGTVGAALSSALSGTRSIALSYATVVRPTPISVFEPAHVLSLRIIKHLWDNWGKDEGGLRNGEVDLYNVNIPMIEGLLNEQGLQICWTSIWRNTYGRLFKALPIIDTTLTIRKSSDAGPDAPIAQSTTFGASVLSEQILMQPGYPATLAFGFSPEMKGLINPDESALMKGSDGWALMKGYVSVTPLRASYAEPPSEDLEIPWKSDSHGFKVSQLKL